MAPADNTYSRFVAWMKILLPLLALALLSTLFLVARTIDPAQNLPFADIDVDDLAREQRIGRPNYSGTTADGAAISLAAESARPDPEDPKRITGAGVRAAIDLPSGDRVEIAANAMRLDTAARVITLSDGVVVETSDGYTLRTAAIDVAMDRTRVEATAPAEVDGPLGRLAAGRFVLTGGGTDRRPYVLVFKSGVKLVYDPNE